MFIFFVFIVFMFIFVFRNRLNYSIILLFISLIVLIGLVSKQCLSLLIFCILMIVYSGAIIILIGYICAVCPNLVLSSSLDLFKIIIIVLLNFIYLLFFKNFLGELSLNINLNFIVDYFYTYWGLIIFIVLILMLFIVLLIVTSQYISPKGPLRSIV